MPHSHERARRRCSLAARIPTIRTRSEEHTSELQSQSNLVCRLLLEKKKTTHAALNLHLNLTHVIDRYHPTQHTIPISSLYYYFLQSFAQSLFSYPSIFIALYALLC